MYEVKIDPQKNRLYIILKGFLKNPEMQEVVDEVIRSIDKMKPGFDIITDLSEFKPVSQEGTEYLKRAQMAVYKSEVRKVVRVVKHVISAMQFTRIQREIGADYEVIEANTLEEAERILDEG